MSEGFDESIRALLSVREYSHGEYKIAEAIKALPTDHPQLITRWLIRILGRPEAFLRSNAQNVLGKMGLEKLAEKTLEAISGWDSDNLVSSLGEHEAARIWQVCSSQFQSSRYRSGTDVNRDGRDSVKNALDRASDAMTFLYYLGDSDLAWQWVVGALQDARDRDLAELVSRRLDTPAPFAGPDAACMFPALICAVLCRPRLERRITSLIRLLVEQPELRAQFVTLLCDEDSLLETQSDREKIIRLLRLGQALSAHELRPRAYSSLGSRYSDLSEAGAKFLSAIHEHGAADMIRRVLTTGDATLIDAIKGEIGVQLLIRPFQTRLNEGSVSEGCLQVLWKLRNDAIIPELIALAKTKSSGETSASAIARRMLITQCGQRAVEPVLKELKNEYGEGVESLTSILAEIIPSSHFFKLLTNSSQEKLGVRVGRLKGGEWRVLVEIFVALGSQLAPVRRDAAVAAQSLASSSAPALLPRLIPLLVDSRDTVRSAALQAIRAFAIPDSPFMMVDQLGRTPEGIERSYLIDAIASSKPGEDLLSECLASDLTVRNRGALYFLAQNGVPRSVKHLVREALQSSDWITQFAAIECVAIAKDLCAVVPLLALSNAAEPRVREKATNTLRILIPALSLLETIRPADPRSFSKDIYSWLLSTPPMPVAQERQRSHSKGISSWPAPKASAPIAEEDIADLLAIGDAFAGTSEAVANLMPVLDGVTAADIQQKAAGRFILAVALCAAARCAHRRDFVSATILQEQVAAIAGRLGEPEIEWRALLAIGVHEESVGNDSGAWSAFNRASAVIDRTWFGVLNESEGRMFFKDKAILYDRIVLCALRLGYDALALEFTEKAKTRYLGDLIARRQRARRTELAPVISRYWLALDSQSDSSTYPRDFGVAQNVVTSVSWGVDKADDIQWTPRHLARWIQEGGSAKSGIEPQKVWQISAWLVESPNDIAQQMLDEIYTVFAWLRRVASTQAATTAGERDEMQQRYDIASVELLKIARPEDVPLWVFAEMGRASLVERLMGHIASNPTAAPIELNALVEALNGSLRHETVTAVHALRDASSEELSCRVVPTATVPTSKRSQFESVLAEVTSTEWRYVERLLRGEPVTYQRVRQSMVTAQQSALVQFYLTQSGTVAFLVGNVAGQSPELFSFPDVTVECLNDLLFGKDKTDGWFSRFGAWHSETREAWANTVDQILSDLYNQLFVPLAPRLKALGVQRLLLIPHRGLHVLPLHALFTVTGGRRRYVLDDFEVVYAPSSTLAQIAMERHRAAYGSKSLLCVRPSANDRRNLRYSDTEARAVAAQFAANNRVLRDTEAILSTIRETAPLRSHFHFTGHGQYNTESPLDSKLELTTDPHIDVGGLFENATPMARVELATLSACETALTDPHDVADEYIGISGGFLFAGVANVLCTLWAVPDVTTVLLMDRFYGCLLSLGDTHDDFMLSRVLRQAQLWLRDLTLAELKRHLKHPKCRIDDEAKLEILELFTRLSQQSGSRPFSGPLYWAPFILTSGFPSPTRPFMQALPAKEPLSASQQRQSAVDRIRALWRRRWDR
jgi:CHAT domain-containing protein